MTLSKEETRALIHMLATAGPDEIECDQCYEHFAEFVEQQLLGEDSGEWSAKVENHINQCPCCGDEHKALMEALQVVYT